MRDVKCTWYEWIGVGVLINFITTCPFARDRFSSVQFGSVVVHPFTQDDRLVQFWYVPSLRTTARFDLWYVPSLRTTGRVGFWCVPSLRTTFGLG